VAFCVLFNIKITAISATTTIASTTETMVYVPVSGPCSTSCVGVGEDDEVEALGGGGEVAEGGGGCVGVAAGVDEGVAVGAGGGVGAGETSTATVLDWIEVASKLSVTVAVTE